MGAATRRIKRELEELKASESLAQVFRNIEVDDGNILEWEGQIIPENPPYNQGAFRIKIVFPVEYPFKPPKVTFKTKIYHPNVDEKGQVCLSLIIPENWKPATKIAQVIQLLVSQINEPNLENPLRGEILDEFVNDRKKFMKNAEEFTRQHAEPRS